VWCRKYEEERKKREEDENAGMHNSIKIEGWQSVIVALPRKSTGTASSATDKLDDRSHFTMALEHEAE
jgi:hypothetical protein